MSQQLYGSLTWFKQRVDVCEQVALRRAPSQGGLGLLASVVDVGVADVCVSCACSSGSSL